MQHANFADAMTLICSFKEIWHKYRQWLNPVKTAFLPESRGWLLTHSNSMTIKLKSWLLPPKSMSLNDATINLSPLVYNLSTVLSLLNNVTPTSATQPILNFAESVLSVTTYLSIPPSVHLLLRVWTLVTSSLLAGFQSIAFKAPNNSN